VVFVKEACYHCTYLLYIYIYIDDLIVQLKQSGHIEQLFVGCVCYADDIALLSASCYGLQKLVDICSSYGISWDIKFNLLKSQLITFGGCNQWQLYPMGTQGIISRYNFSV